MTPEHFKDWLTDSIKRTEEETVSQEDSIRMKTRSQGKLTAYRAVLQMFKSVIFNPIESTDVEPIYEDEFERVEFTTQDNSPVEIVKCCHKLIDELKYSESVRKHNHMGAFDISVSGLHRVYVGTKHIAGNWQLEYCPFCGEKINIKFKHPF